MNIEDYINEGWRIYFWDRKYKPFLFERKIKFVKEYKNLIFVK